MVVVIFGGGANVATSQLERRVVFGVVLCFLTKKKPTTRVDEKPAEQVHHPVKAVQQRLTRADEHAAHDHRAGDAPKQHALLTALAQAEVAEQHQKYE